MQHKADQQATRRGRFGWVLVALCLLLLLVGPGLLAQGVSGTGLDERRASLAHRAFAPLVVEGDPRAPMVFPTASLTPSTTPTLTHTPTPTQTPTATATETPTTSATPTATATSTQTASPTLSPTVSASSGGWWDSRWRARAKIEVGGSAHERTDVVAETLIDFTAKLQDAGLRGTFDETHLRLVETDADGRVLDDNVPFQFDPDPDYDADNQASGLLVLLLEGQTGTAQVRHLFAYLDTTDNENGKEPGAVSSRVSYQDNVSYEGQASYKITSDNATFFYHKLGSGFAAMVDDEGQDWISYRPTGGAAGHYRGIPNVATNDASGGLLGLFHPGYTLSNSTILHSGPIKLTIRSRRNDDTWEKTWEIFPRAARMTLTRKPAGKQYWFLYEGTPGGGVDANDYYVLADGLPQSIDSPISSDLPGEEWLYFGDTTSAAVLYLANHEEDEAIDCHTVTKGLMTVFGFGRDRSDVAVKGLDAVPGRFTIGFLPSADHQTLARRIRSAYMPLDVAVGPGEAAPVP